MLPEMMDVVLIIGFGGLILVSLLALVISVSLLNRPKKDLQEIVNVKYYAQVSPKR